MTDQPKQDAIVSQRARDFAKSILWVETLIDDVDAIAMAFDTYRAEIEAATIERCAGVAQTRKDEWDRAIAGGLKRMDVTKEYAVGAMTEAELLVLNLRNLKGQTS